MLDKIKEFAKTNVIGLSLGLFIVIFVFILPQFFYTEIVYEHYTKHEPMFMLLVIQLLVAFVSIGYVAYKLRLFIKKNKGVKLSEMGIADGLGSVVAILIGLFFGFILMFIIDPGSSFPGLFVIIRGGFRDMESVGDMINFSVPFILTGLSVAFAFRTGLFNIGASGQLTMGAFAAVYIGVKWGFLGDITPLLHWGVALLGAIVAGGIWGAIPGILKAYRNVNEVVASIMLNYVAMYLNVIMIKAFMYNGFTNGTVPIESSAVTPTLNLGWFFTGSSINMSILVALVVVIILHIVLKYTTFGFELKSVGFNRNASKYAGMNAKRNIVYSMIIAGAIAGLAGGLIYLVSDKYIIAGAILAPQGFTGIAISLLGLSSPIGVLFAGLFYASIQMGGNFLQLVSNASTGFDGYKPEIIDIIIGVIIYAAALALFIKSYILKFFRAFEKKKGSSDVEGSDE